MSEKRNPADTINEAAAGLAGQFTEALAAALDHDIAAADHQVTTLESRAIGRLRDDAETVADRFEAVAAEARAGQRRAHAERTQLSGVRKEIEEGLQRLAVAPIEERGNGRRRR